MGFGNNGGKKGPSVYLKLDGGETGGFKHFTGMSEPTDGSPPQRIVHTYSYVTGFPVGFFVNVEVAYAAAVELRKKGVDPRKVDMEKLPEYEKNYVAALHLKDAKTGEIQAVTFDLYDNQGGKIAGMLNNLRMNNAMNQDLKLFFFHRGPNTKYNSADKGKDSINMAPTSATTKEENIPAIFLKDGVVLMNPADHEFAPNQPAMLPMGKVVAVDKGRSIWVFDERDAVIAETAVALCEHFSPKAAPTDASAEHESVDPSEAFAAAAPAN